MHWVSANVLALRRGAPLCTRSVRTRREVPANAAKANQRFSRRRVPRRTRSVRTGARHVRRPMLLRIDPPAARRQGGVSRRLRATVSEKYSAQMNGRHAAVPFSSHDGTTTIRTGPRRLRRQDPARIQRADASELRHPGRTTTLHPVSVDQATRRQSYREGDAQAKNPHDVASESARVRDELNEPIMRARESVGAVCPLTDEL